MRALWLRLRLSNSNFGFSPYLYSSSSSPPLLNSLPSLASPSASSIVTNLFTAPWSAFQLRGIKVSGSDIRVGNLIGKQGCLAFGLLNFYSLHGSVILTNEFTMHFYRAGHARFQGAFTRFLK